MVVVLLLTFYLVSKNCICDPYPIYHASGTYYEVGYQIGEQAKDRILHFIDIYPDMPTLRQYISTSNGNNEFSNLISYNHALYEYYFDELRGISDGSGANYTDILLINFEYELDALMQMSNFSISTRFAMDSCSDLYVFNEGIFVGHAHNEDDWNGSLSTAYFTNSTYYKDDVMFNHIFGFNFIPAILPGSSSPSVSLFNSLTYDINYLFPLTVTQYGKATSFVCRAVLESKNISDAINQIGVYGGNVSVGASFNMGHINKSKTKYTFEMANVENYMDKYSVLYVNNQNYSYHFNAYLRLQNIAQNQSESSSNRYNRTLEMIKTDFNGTLTNKNEILQILGDQNNTQWPIYRTGYMTTLATSLYDLQNAKAYWYEQCNPKNCTPSIVIDL
eukprot:362935_1